MALAGERARRRRGREVETKNQMTTRTYGRRAIFSILAGILVWLLFGGFAVAPANAQQGPSAASGASSGAKPGLSTPGQAAGGAPASPAASSSLSWNGPDAVNAYRRSWNPLTAGPSFTARADTVPAGEYNGRFFAYGDFAVARYGSNGGVSVLPPSVHQNQTLEVGTFAYGLTDNFQIFAAPSLIGSFTRLKQTANVVNGFGFNDFLMGAKYRLIVQDPETMRPTVSAGLALTIPTASWSGTELPKGALAPISIVPEARGGSPAINYLFQLRKNIQPLEYYADFYYAYGFPNGSLKFGDIMQERLAVEYVLDDARGQGLIFEFIGLNGLPFSMDGLPVTAGQRHFNLFGFQPSYEINLTPNLIFSAGVLLPVAGSNEFASLTPNVSLWWYWNRGQAVVPR